MEEIIYEKLNKIKDLNDRVILKNIMNSVFSSLEKYTEERYDYLEKRVFDEIPYIEEKYNIYSTIVKQNKLDPTDEVMFPILEEDTSQKEYETKDIVLNLKKKNKLNLFKVFVEADYLTFKKLLNSEQVFSGSIETDKKVHECYFKVKKNNQYTKKIENLYKSFINNNIKWTTINDPYINKVADVYLIRCKDEISEEESILKIDVDFGEYKNYMKYNMVPMWNIKMISKKCDGFPTPCIDKVSFEHKISIVKEGVNNGYLVNAENQDINYVIMQNQSVIISTNTNVSEKWNIFKIVNCKDKKLNYEYKVMSNSAKVNFSNRMSMEKRYTIKTKSELSRTINSFEDSKHLKLKEISLQDRRLNTNSETYEVNDFIIDEIREDDIKKNLVLSFDAVDKDDYLINDILSFIVSEVQLIYPEYECVGKLL